VFEESPLNPGVIRGLRTKRLRQVSKREADFYRQVKADRHGPVTPSPVPAVAALPDDPIVVLDDTTTEPSAG
jgi:hypothetical protein